MSRQIDLSDPSSLTEDDKLYLQDRGLLPEGVDRVENKPPTEADLAEEEYTGDVNTPKPSSARIPSGNSLPAAYKDRSVPELKQELQGRGLPVTGNKAELVERLNKADAEVSGETGTSTEDNEDNSSEDGTDEDLIEDEDDEEDR